MLQENIVNDRVYDKIAINALYNLLKGTVAFLITLVLPLVIICYIGLDGYGIWVLLQFLIFSGTFLDMGINLTITKYTAEYDAKKDTESILKLINTFFIVYFFMFVFIFILIFLFKLWIVKTFFKVLFFKGEDISSLLLVICAIFGIQNMFSIYPSFLNGLQRMDITNKIVIASSLINFFLSIFFLAFGLKIFGLVLAYFFSLVIATLLYIKACFKIAPYLRFTIFFSKEIFLQVFKFNLFSAIGMISTIIHVNINKLLISYFLGLRFLAYYDIAHKVVALPWNALQSLIYPIMPAVANIYHGMGQEKIKLILKNTLNYVIGISFPLFTFIIIFSDIIIEFWFGKGYQMASLALKFLAIAYLASILTSPGSSILVGMGLQEAPVYSGILTALLNLILVIILIKIKGFLGLLIGTLLAYVLGAIYFYYLFGKIIHVEPRKIFKISFLLTITIILIIIIFLRFITYNIGNINLNLAISLFTFLIIYSVFLLKNENYKGVRDIIKRSILLDIKRNI